ncbi:MAG TPA: hypothetical protein DCY13_13425 [Verrucomicrobiales bacterium]|nr:hypothetical protein [Verrucomicrobiales bacterium]
MDGQMGPSLEVVADVGEIEPVLVVDRQILEIPEEDAVQFELGQLHPAAVDREEPPVLTVIVGPEHAGKLSAGHEPGAFLEIVLRQLGQLQDSVGDRLGELRFFAGAGHRRERQPHRQQTGGPRPSSLAAGFHGHLLKCCSFGHRNGVTKDRTGMTATIVAGAWNAWEQRRVIGHARQAVVSHAREDAERAAGRVDSRAGIFPSAGLHRLCEWVFAGYSRNTAMSDTIIHPVIFIPGITASELSDEYPADHERVWGVLRKDFARIALHPDETRYEAKEPAVVRADRVFRLVYEEFIEELRHNLSPQPDQPTPVFAFPYDWRQPLERTARDLAAFIDEVIGRTGLLRHYHRARYDTDPKVNLVGHSMGGLVIAEYLAQNPSQHRVHKLASLGTPYRGSFEAVLKVATGTAAIGSNQSASREREVARVTPALYHLLPRYPGAVAPARGLESDLFNVATWQPSVMDSIETYVRLYGLRKGNDRRRAEQLFGVMLQQAAEHRSRVDTLNLAGLGLDSRRWLTVIGVGEETRVRLRIARGADGRPAFDLASKDRSNDWKVRNWRGKVNTGDGTVPYLGARPEFIPVNELVCVSDDDFGYWELKDRLLEGVGAGLHATLPLMNLCQRIVVSHLRGRPFGKVWGRPAPDIGSAEWNPPVEMANRSGKK